VTRNLAAYREIVINRLRQAIVYRHNTFFLIALVVLQIFALRMVWTAVYAGDDAGLHRILAYTTMASLQNWFMQDPTISEYLHDRVRDGQIVFDLMRPAGLVPQLAAHSVGAGIAAVSAALVAVPVAAVAGELSPPASSAALAFYLVGVVLGFAIGALSTALVGMVSFWSPEIAGVGMIYALVSQFLSGALVPISFFPTPLRVVADLLPFQATTYGPVTVYLGGAGTAAVRMVGVQLLWCAMLGVGAQVLWRRAIRRTVVQGG
jgi:ABC-2 type transport system permease protein